MSHGEESSKLVWWRKQT